jgi:hypothetical protein
MREITNQTGHTKPEYRRQAQQKRYKDYTSPPSTVLSSQFSAPAVSMSGFL